MAPRIDATSLARHRSDPPQLPHRKSRHQLGLDSRSDDGDAVGLGQSRRDLGDLFSGSGTDRGDQPGLGENQCAQAGAELLHLANRRPGQFERLTERLVDRELLEDGHGSPQRLEGASAQLRVENEPRRQHHGPGPHQSASLMHRHGRARSERAGLVAATGHHSPPARATDENRAAPQRGSRQLFGGGEERVHVQVQHPSTTPQGVVGGIGHGRQRRSSVANPRACAARSGVGSDHSSP